MSARIFLTAMLSKAEVYSVRCLLVCFFVSKAHLSYFVFVLLYVYYDLLWMDHMIY